MSNEEWFQQQGKSKTPDVSAYQRYRRADEAGASDAPRRPGMSAIAALICAALIAVGSWGPWLHFERRGVPTDTLRGLETDGALSLVAGVVAFVAIATVLTRSTAELAAWVGLIAVVLGALIGVGSWLDMGTFADGYGVVSPGREAKVGWGPVVVTVAGAIGTCFAYRVLQHVRDF
ncbi:MAG: hypothetical protein ACRDJW_22800 [Thermomicrobiales bacterium]